ncbi:acylphosphatase [Methylophaga sp.]|uniref:acylphosphatase n=1 Tax=Methylophaga sp. TaxID=2024840 RepID=UPI003F69FF93
MGIKQHHLLISGHVQGVSYRVSAWEKAQQLGLMGWVKNLPDGRVEMLVEGDEAALQKMMAWAEKGPCFAKVSNVTISEQPATDQFSDFQIR